jgi:hypothetical protein
MAFKDYMPKGNHSAEIAAIHDLHGGRLGLPRASSLPAALDQADQHLGELREFIDQEAPEEPPRTDREQIAHWVVRLTYTEMKQFASEVLGEAKPVSANELADLFEAWAAKTVGAEVAS